jgi:hypothetical protein
MGYLTLILQSLASLLKWLALKEEVKLKTLLLDRKEKYEDESEEKQKQIDDARAAGRHDYADRLYDTYVIGRTQLVVDIQSIISNAEKGNVGTNPEGTLHPPSR